MAAAAPSPSFDSTQGVRPKQLVWPPDAVYLASVERIKDIWVGVESGSIYRIQNGSLGGRELPPFEEISLSTERRLRSAQPSQLPDGQRLCFVPPFNEEEIATIKKSLPPIYASHGMPLHTLLSLALFLNFQENQNPEIQGLIERCKNVIRKFTSISAFLGNDREQLYPIWQKQKKELAIILGLLQESPHLTKIGRAICKLWSRHLQYYSYTSTFMKNGATDHPQLRKLLQINKNKQTMRNFSAAITDLYKLEPVNFDSSPRAQYETVLGQYFKPRKPGQTYTDHQLSNQTRIDQALEKAIRTGNVDDFTTVPHLFEPSQTSGRNFLLNAMAYQNGDCPEYFDPMSIPIACNRSLETLKALFAEHPEIKNANIRRHYNDLLTLANNTYNSSDSGRVSKKLVALSEEYGEGVSFSEITDTLRRITGDLRFDLILKNIYQLKTQLFPKDAPVDEVTKQEFLLLIEFTLNLAQLQLDIYRLRDLYVHDELENLEEKIRALGDFSEPENEEPSLEVEKSIEPAGALPPEPASEEEPQSPKSVGIVAPKPLSPEQKKQLEEKEDWICRLPTPAGTPKPREIVREIKQNGFVLQRYKGSHQQWIHPKYQLQFTLAIHDTKDSISPKSLKEIYFAISKVRSAENYERIYGERIAPELLSTAIQEN